MEIETPRRNRRLRVISEITNLAQIPEMHDRIITATAKLNRAVLITKDPDIVEAGMIETIW